MDNNNINLELSKDKAIDLYNVLYNFIKENDIFTNGFKTAREILKILSEQGVD